MSGYLPPGTIACRVPDWAGSEGRPAAADLDVLYMPEEMRRDFCLELLENFGAEKISIRENRGEITHCCVAPWHDETHPSASLNWEKMTYRCLGCPARGGILWLIGITQGVYGPEAREWLAGQTGVGGSEFQLAPLLRFLDALEESRTKTSRPAPLTRFSPTVLDPWQQIYPGLTTGAPDLGIVGRGIPEANLVEARVGWNLDDDRVIIPHFWDGDLLGWQGRRIFDTQPEKYKSTPDFPRDRTLYLPQQIKPSRKIVVVESPMSVLRHMHHLPIGATFGAAVTDRQVDLLRWYPEIVFWVDNDKAGWSVLEGHWDEKGIHHPGAAQRLEAYSDVRAVVSDWAGDPAEFDDDTAEQLVAEAVPLPLWSRPTALRCMSCRNYHGGPCA